MRALLVSAALLALSACHKAPQQPANEGAPAAEAGPHKGVDRSHHGGPAPAAGFTTPDGGLMTLAKFDGVPLVVNLWASWCAPCVKELPTLDKLAASHRVDGQLGVLAISEDSGPEASVAAFLRKLNVRDLGAYHDPKMALS